MKQDSINFKHGKKHKRKLITFNIEHNAPNLHDEFDEWYDGCEPEDENNVFKFIDFLKAKGYEAKQFI